MARIMALEVIQKDGKISAVPVWQSGDMIMPDPPVVANGVLYATQTGGQAMQNFLKPGDRRMRDPRKQHHARHPGRQSAALRLRCGDAASSSMTASNTHHQLGAFQRAGGGDGQGVPGHP